MPVRLTDTIDKKRRLYRYRRGFVVDWVLHPEEASTDIENGCHLSHLPLTAYVKFPGASWQIHPDLEPGVYPLTPVSRTWLVNKHTGVKARRTGFFLLPDFASTAHMIQGTSLDAVLCASPTSPSLLMWAILGPRKVKTFMAWSRSPHGCSNQDHRRVQSC